MDKSWKLTDLLTQDPPDARKLMLYSRAMNNNCYDTCLNLGKIAFVYQDIKKRGFSQVTPLYAACHADSKPEVIRALVKEGWSVNSDLGNLTTPLSIALELGHISVAATLIELGADVEMVHQSENTCNLYTPMWFALSTQQKKEKRSIAAIKLLLDSGVSVDAVTNIRNHGRVIHIAVENKLISVVSFLLQRGANLNIQREDGLTPLHIAVIQNHLNIVKLLLLHDADVSIESYDGNTALIFAIQGGNSEIVEELISSGCDINRPSAKIRILPLHFAICMYNIEMVKLLITLGADATKALPCGTTPLHLLAIDDSIKKVSACTQDKETSKKRNILAEILVENGAAINAVNEDKKTPLQLAVESGCIRLAKLFLELGADVNTYKSDGDTIFHQIVPCNRDIIILFLELGGNYNTCNQEGMTPYHYALSHGVDLKYIKSFLKHGCPYDQNSLISSNLVISNKIGKAFFASEQKLFKGIKENNLELVKLAVMDGAVPTSCCEDIKYPLHFVALHGFNELLAFLLEEKAQPNILNEEGQTPLYLAASKGCYDACYILLRHGACYNYFSKKCPKTPRMIASERKHDAVVNLLNRVNYMFCKAKTSKIQHVVKHLKSAAGSLEVSSDYLMYVNATDMKGNTLLTTALEHKQYGVAEILLKMRLEYDLSNNS